MPDAAPAQVPDATTGEITVDDGIRAEAVSAARELGFPTDAVLGIDEALADVGKVVTAGNALYSVLQGLALTGSFKPSSGWDNAGSCAMVSSGAITLTARALGGGETLHGSVTYDVSHFQADVTDAPYLIGTYESTANLATTGSHINGTGGYVVDLVPAAAPPNGLHQVFVLDIDVGFDGAARRAAASGSLSRRTSRQERAPSRSSTAPPAATRGSTPKQLPSIAVRISARLLRNGLTRIATARVPRVRSGSRR